MAISTLTSLKHILTPRLLDYVNRITFPWPHEKPLDGSDVGRVFFGKDYDATPDWSTDQVTDALEALSKLPLREMHGADLLELVQKAHPKPKDTLQIWSRIIGLIILFDQGSRYLCGEGTNGRWIYHFFDIIAHRIVQALLKEHHPIFSLSAWQDHCHLDLHHSIIRIIMILPPLVHSEDLTDQTMQLHLTEDLRQSYEHATDTRDPHRATFRADKRDIGLFGRHLDAGPPRGQGVRMENFVYWIMRYYTAHLAYVRHFQGRSPFRNVAVGRPDREGERPWLESNHVVWTEEDERTRAKIARDVAQAKWTSLRLGV